MEEDLRIMEESGYELYLNNERKSPGVIARACMIRENGSYECRTVPDTDPPQLLFNRVKEDPSRLRALPRKGGRSWRP